MTTHGWRNHAVRVDQWRYIRYADGSEELYDHSKDEYEWNNLAEKVAFAKIKTELAKHLPAVEKPAGKRKNSDEDKSNNQ
jgi:hypothetical protein